jgi:endonuclease-8
MSAEAMPEGDTLYRIAAGLRPRLIGKRVLTAVPASLAGASVVTVETKGKHLLITFADGRVLHTHLGMTGTWHVYRPGERWWKPRHLARAVLEVEDAVAVCFLAPRVEVRREQEVPLAHLGPDLLSPDFDLDTVVARARAAEPVTLGELLLYQRVCAGIGNIWKCESLWRLRLDPWRRVSETDDLVLRRLYQEARTLMLASSKGRRPAFAVHGRAGRLCPRCGGRVAARRQGHPPRVTYFCPNCQTPPTAPEL